MEHAAISGEDFPSRVAATFDSQRQASTAADRLVGEAGLSRGQIDIVRPHDDRVGKKVEPDASGVVRTGIRAHVTLGVAGLVLGLGIAAALIFFGVDLAISHAGMTLAVFGFIGAALGMLLAGLITARPDHQKVIAETRDAAHEGKWTVIVQASNHDERQRAHDLLEELSDNISQTF